MFKVGDKVKVIDPDDSHYNHNGTVRSVLLGLVYVRIGNANKVTMPRDDRVFFPSEIRLLD